MTDYPTYDVELDAAKDAFVALAARNEDWLAQFALWRDGQMVGVVMLPMPEDREKRYLAIGGLRLLDAAWQIDRVVAILDGWLTHVVADGETIGDDEAMTFGIIDRVGFEARMYPYTRQGDGLVSTGLTWHEDTEISTSWIMEALAEGLVSGNELVDEVGQMAEMIALKILDENGAVIFVEDPGKTDTDTDTDEETT